METPEDYTEEQLFDAAIYLAGSKSRRASRELSRKTDKSYILIGAEGDILSRHKLSDVHKRCRLLAARSDSTGSIKYKSLSSANGRVIISCLLFGGATYAFASLGSHFLREERLKDELSRNRIAYANIREATSNFARFQTIAQSTPRIALSSPVTKLQELQRDTENMQVGPCLSDPLKTITSGETGVIDGLIHFMDSDNSELVAAEMISLGTKDVATGMDLAKKCLSVNYLRLMRQK